MLDKKRQQKIKEKAKTGQTRPFLDFTKKLSSLPRVVLAEEPKTGLRLKIRPHWEDVIDGQSSCTSCMLLS